MGLKIIFKMALTTTLLSCGSSSPFYSLVAHTIQGEQVVGWEGSTLDMARMTSPSQVDFAGFEGKVVLVVNVASQCGYTDSHYR